MNPLATSGFPHRHNTNGSYDSICTTCHSTVASACIEAQLDAYERDHSCNPSRIYQLREDQLRTQAPVRMN
jgi:hypothetical protein